MILVMIKQRFNSSRHISRGTENEKQHDCKVSKKNKSMIIKNKRELLLAHI